MFAFARALFFGALGLVVLVPLAIFLAAIGLPVALVLGLVALKLALFILVPLMILGWIVRRLVGGDQRIRV